MNWEQWLETTLNSMEEVYAAHDIAFDRDEAARHIEQMVKIFGALKQATGIEPGMLRASETPEADLERLVGQLETWKMIDRKTAAKDEAEGRLERAKRSLDLAHNQLDYSDLKADADGVITATLAEPGQVVAIGQPVVRQCAHRDVRCHLRQFEPRREHPGRVGPGHRAFPHRFGTLGGQLHLGFHQYR